MSRTADGSVDVRFNKDQYFLYKELINNKKTSEDFSDFVKNAFHDKIDSLRGGSS